MLGIVRQDDGYIGINFEVFGADGNKLASVKCDQIYTFTRTKGRFQFDGSPDMFVMIDRISGETLVRIRKRVNIAPDELDVSVRTYLPDGRLMNLGPESSNIPGLFWAGCTFRANGRAGVEIG